VERATGHYLLGNGYRAYNPVLMNFNSPDSMSPFAKGGLNGYGYCQRDPVNNKDPSGHVKVSAMLLSKVPRLVLLGYHATDAFNVKGLLQGVSRGHSRPDRRAQGEAFYIGSTRDYVKPYKDKAIDGVILAVVAPEGVLVPEKHFSKDVFDVTAVNPAGYGFLTVLEEVPPGVESANLPRTGKFASSAGATVVKSAGAEAPFVEAVKIRETQT
jgi:RHS repeat-associated protein